MICIKNYFRQTKAFFKGCKTPKRNPDYISYDKHTGDISSRYWYGNDKIGGYVIRESNHWSNYKEFDSNHPVKGCGMVASCKWGIKTNNNTRRISGKAYFNDFIPINQ